mgnify:CR=1 FL=1
MKPTTLLVLGLLGGVLVQADSLPPGTYVKRGDPSAGRLIMIIAAMGAGRRLTYRVVAADGSSVLVSTRLKHSLTAKRLRS